ncbi:hypothetical protein Bca4012_055465 [Brassica carinata]
MIQLLFLVLFLESAIAFLLLVKIGPLRELVIKSLDQLKLGKVPATLKTIAGTMSVILCSNLMNIIKIQNKGAKLGTMSPMDQVLWRTHLLEASLLGVVLFLGFVIDKTHHYLGKLITLRSNVGSSKGELEQLRKERTELKEKEEETSKEIKQLKEKLSCVSENLKRVEKEAIEKETKLKTAEAHVTSLQKQASELLLEYDRLLEDNQTLQNHTMVEK